MMEQINAVRIFASYSSSSSVHSRRCAGGCTAIKVTPALNRENVTLETNFAFESANFAAVPEISQGAVYPPKWGDVRTAANNIVFLLHCAKAEGPCSKIKHRFRRQRLCVFPIAGNVKMIFSVGFPAHSQRGLSARR